MFIYNVEAGRELKEGDEVRVLVGPRSGETGTVVGFDLLSSETPVVVQYEAKSGLVRQTLAANDVEVSIYTEAPDTLEPLPEIRRVLTEGAKVDCCGNFLRVRVSSGVLSFVPKDQSAVLRQIYESSSHHTLEGRLFDVAKYAFVTRLPHLVKKS